MNVIIGCGIFIAVVIVAWAIAAVLVKHTPPTGYRYDPRDDKWHQDTH